MITLLPLKSDLSDAASRSIENTARSLMLSQYQDLYDDYDVGRSQNSIVLVPRDDDMDNDDMDAITRLQDDLLADEQILLNIDLNKLFDSDDESDTNTPERGAYYTNLERGGDTSALFGRASEGRFDMTPFNMNEQDSDDDLTDDDSYGMRELHRRDERQLNALQFSDDDSTTLPSTSVSSDDLESLSDLSSLVDNAEMRNISGEAETKEQRKLAEDIAKAIAGTSSFTREDTLDSNGKPKPLSELMRMARVASLWPVLSELQKSQIMDTPGVLANDRHYIARNVLIGTPIRKKRPFVQNGQGKIIYV
jgi:hypothetical protein